MKRILVTGAAGFIGSHLVELLVEKGFSVTAFDRYNSDSTFGWLENSDKKKDIKFILGDIRDYDSVYKSLNEIDIVIHLAALIGIPYSYSSPLAYIRTNIEGTYNILESSKNRNLDQVLITSTSETYGTAQYVPIDENHPLVGQSPYSATKIAADQLSLSFFKSFSMPIKVVRPFNTYGPRQSRRAVIPTIISQLSSGNKYLKLGDVSPTRDFTYVFDTANGFVEIMNCDEAYGEVVNIGSENEISIENLALKIGQIMGKTFQIEHDSSRFRPKDSEVERLFCNSEKLKSLTSWKPSTSLNKGLEQTIEWVNENINKNDTDKYIV